jgi:hypothetical protein
MLDQVEGWIDWEQKYMLHIVIVIKIATTYA